jgi:hypothetical protein
MVDMGEYYLIGGDIGVKKESLKSTSPRQVYFNQNPMVAVTKQGHITVRIDGTVASNGSNYDYHGAIPLAINQWNALGTNIKFTLTTSPVADITIRAQNLSDPNLYAQIDDWPTNGLPSQYISINNLCNYAGLTFTNEQKKWIIVHELGHAVNFAHTQDYSLPYASKIGSSPDVDANSVFNAGMAGNTYSDFSYWDQYSINTMYPAVSPTTGTVPVYRYFRAPYLPNYGPIYSDHLFTTSFSELGGGHPNFYNYEGTAFSAFPTQVPGSIPVYRYFYQPGWNHFYTTDSTEVIATPTSRWQYEGIAFYAYASPINGSVPVYRYYNSTVNDHHYTKTMNEKSVNSYTYEKVEFYAY